MQLFKKLIICLLIIAGLLTYAYYWAFIDMGRLPKGKLISEAQSPDGTYTIKAYLSDGGATTSYAVLGELNFNTIKKKPQNIYWNYREDFANIKWVDNDTVMINDHTLNVPADRFDYRRKH
ncbi:MAG: DUF5412 domain-containing protein [Clostridia bacterium]|nr:DUF5412 domain-containing protein [Clostridia bacterium]